MTAVDKIYAAFRRCTLADPKKPFSVSELCREAGVNRATFYRYFKNEKEMERSAFHFYVSTMLDTVIGKKRVTSLRVLEKIAERFWKVMDIGISRVSISILNRYMTEEYLLLFSELFINKLDPVISPSLVNGSELKRSFLSRSITTAFILWAYSYVTFINSNLEDVHIKQDVFHTYLKMITDLVDKEKNPYDYLPPDRVDIISSLIDYGIQGKRFLNVTELCRYAGITRQGFYRQYKNLDACYQSFSDFEKSLISFFLANRLFGVNEPVNVPKLRTIFSPPEYPNFSIFHIDKVLLDAFIAGMLDVFGYTIIILQQSLGEQTLKKLWFHLFYYFCTYALSFFYYYCYRDEQTQKKVFAFLNEYTFLVPELKNALEVAKRSFMELYKAKMNGTKTTF